MTFARGPVGEHFRSTYYSTSILLLRINVPTSYNFLQKIYCRSLLHLKYPISTYWAVNLHLFTKNLTYRHLNRVFQFATFASYLSPVIWNLQGAKRYSLPSNPSSSSAYSCKHLVSPIVSLKGKSEVKRRVAAG